MLEVKCETNNVRTYLEFAILRREFDKIHEWIIAKNKTENCVFRIPCCDLSIYSEEHFKRNFCDHVRRFSDLLNGNCVSCERINVIDFDIRRRVEFT